MSKEEIFKKRIDEIKARYTVENDEETKILNWSLITIIEPTVDVILQKGPQ